MIRRPATEHLLLARAIGIVAVIVAYAVVRGPYLTSTLELAISWVSVVVLAFWFERTMMRWDDLRHARSLVAIRSELPTEVIPPVREWPGEVELAIADARHAAMLPMIDRGEVVEPKLFTHEFQPLTPPSGTPLPMDDHRIAKREAIRQAYTPPAGRHRANIGDWPVDVTTTSPSGRHALADAQLNRERAHDLFGQW